MPPNQLPPLSVYVHIPWCVRKCPYCDFNSHALRGELDAHAYVEALLADLEQDLPCVDGREAQSIFIGGGTPSLFSGDAISGLLTGIDSRIGCRSNLEVTLEANPGAVEARRFAQFREAGVTRLSIGVQSFNDRLLGRIGRIHGRKEALAAVRVTVAAEFNDFNLDLMYGLPGQTLNEAISDMETAIALEPSHISYYQLTLEPNTRFGFAAPSLPDEDLIWEMQLQGQALLAQAGYRQYEVSAYARDGRCCRHNLNYWQFGDYLGLGAGAHGKLTRLVNGLKVERVWKARHPETFLRSAGKAASVAGIRLLDEKDLVLEFALNALRLNSGFSLDLFALRTGLAPNRLDQGLSQAKQRGMIEARGETLCPTALGQRFLNDLVNCFDSSD